MTRRERKTSGPTPRLYQRASEILARQIGEGVLAPGTRLQESGIAQQFGISRAPARRALAELAERGLLEKPAGRGYLVRPVARRRKGETAAPPPGAELLEHPVDCLVRAGGPMHVFEKGADLLGDDRPDLAP